MKIKIERSERLNNESLITEFEGTIEEFRNLENEGLVFFIEKEVIDEEMNKFILGNQEQINELKEDKDEVLGDKL